MGEVSGFFFGIGMLMVLGVIAWFFYILFIKLFEPTVRLENKKDFLEEVLIDKIAKKKGYDLELLALERNVKQSKSFRKRLSEEIISEFFGKEAKK